MTAAEYLAWERLQSERHQFSNGEVFSRAGGSPRHNALAAAVTRDLGVALLGGACRVLSSDQRIVARDGEHYVYADASVVCGALELASGTTDVLSNPSVVVEVLSKRTEAYDRGGKWADYQLIPSVRDYLLVAQRSQRIEHFQRTSNDAWHYSVVTAGPLRLSDGLTLDVDRLYLGVFELNID